MRWRMSLALGVLALSGAAWAAPVPSVSELGVVRGDKDVRNTLSLSAVTGPGFGLELDRTIRDHLSIFGGLGMNSLPVAGGNARLYGVSAGVNYFVWGRRNEGVRIGSRLVGEVGRLSQTQAQPVNADNSRWEDDRYPRYAQFARQPNDAGNQTWASVLGITAEAGYSWISRRGLTAGLSTGLRFNALGGFDTSGISGTHVRPFGSVNVGYSW
jgi:hypothetical protein